VQICSSYKLVQISVEQKYRNNTKSYSSVVITTTATTKKIHCPLVDTKNCKCHTSGLVTNNRTYSTRPQRTWPGRLLHCLVNSYSNFCSLTSVERAASCAVSYTEISSTVQYLTHKQCLLSNATFTGRHNNS